ncbi:tyrosine-type recombinase/integrase [Solibacillus sp. FSL H8-0538]|uniref:tyrosine-type recombinase/integrase n=1 Tax=Solibacillus sp. FSL H8-0538 TaxID=2921400 RepID=UPI0030FBD00D
MTDFAELVEHFRVHLMNINKSSHTIKQYTIDCQQFVKYTEQQTYDLFQTPVETVTAYRAHLMATFNAKTSVNRKIASLRSFLQFLQLRGHHVSIPETLLLPVKTDKSQLQLLTEQQLKEALQVWNRIYEHAQEEEIRWIALRNSAIVQTVSQLGLKPAEVVRMKWKHIEHTQIRIKSSRSHRLLPLPSMLKDLLHQYKKETMAFLPAAEFTDFMWLGVGNKQGEPISVKTIERVFKYISEQLGVKVTCTNVRYTLIDRENVAESDEDFELYKRLGYARKGVLKERQDRMHGRS